MKKIAFIVYLLPALISVHGFRIRILGGLDAREGAFGYHAHLSTNRGTRDYCGGAIIHKRWILTAAHCFKDETISRILVQVASIKRSGRGGTFYRIEKRIPHEAYDPETFVHDIALLRVDRDIVFNDQVRPVKLPHQYEILSDNTDVVFTGFGIIKDISDPENLQIISLKVFNHLTCRREQYHVYPTQICTMPKEGKGPCFGDSGGPLVNGHGVLVGIDSGSYGSGIKDCGYVPEFFTRVSSYRDWIDKKIRAHY